MNRNELNDRVIALEAISEERWEAHDKRSKENWDDMKEHLNKLSNKMDKVIETAGNLPCGEMEERLNGFNTRINWLWTIIITVVLSGVVFGMWIKNIPNNTKQEIQQTSSK